MHATHDGFALLGTLLLLALISGFLLNAAARSRAERRIALNHVADLRAGAAARAGVAHALARLDRLQARSAPHAGADVSFAVEWNHLHLLAHGLDEVALEGGACYSITLGDPAARLPLDHAGPTEIRNLLVQLGAHVDEAEAAAQEVVAWREKRPNTPAGRNQAAANELSAAPMATFFDVDELRGLPHWQRFHDAARPFVTAGTGRRVNLNAASATVLRAMPGLSEEAVEQILLLRRTDVGLRNVFELDSRLSPAGQESLRRELGALLGRVSFEPEVIEAVVIGTVNGYALTRAVHLLAVRTGRTVEVVRWTER